MRQVQPRKRNLLHELCVVRVQGQKVGSRDRTRRRRRSKKSDGPLFYLMQTFNCGQAADAAIRHRGLDANLYQLENSGIAVRQGCLLACHTSMQFAAHGGVRMTVIPFNRIERASARRVSSPLISIQELSKELDVPVSTLRGWQARGRMPPRMKQGRQFKYKIADICAGIPLLLDHEIACFTARENAWWTSRNRSTLHLRGGCDLQEV
jgi:hypothetical protein